MACGLAKKPTASPLLSATPGFSTLSTGRNRRSSIHSTGLFGARASQPRLPGRRAIGYSSALPLHYPALGVSFGLTIRPRNVSRDGLARFTSAHSNGAVLTMSIGCITGPIRAPNRLFRLSVFLRMPPHRRQEDAHGRGHRRQKRAGAGFVAELFRQRAALGEKQLPRWRRRALPG